jgi:hypothetical protein
MSDSATCHNCEGAGGAQAKTGEQRTPLDRGAGMSKTIDAMGSKTRSGHPATQMNNLWKDPSLGYGDDNIKT